MVDARRPSRQPLPAVRRTWAKKLGSRTGSGGMIPAYAGTDEQEGSVHRTRVANLKILILIAAGSFAGGGPPAPTSPPRKRSAARAPAGPAPPHHPRDWGD